MKDRGWLARYFPNPIHDTIASTFVSVDLLQIHFSAGFCGPSDELEILDHKTPRIRNHVCSPTDDGMPLLLLLL
jgi:hypothetical protein